VIQILALVYGVHTLAATRPVYVAFNHDRIEIVSAGDIRDDELAAAKSPIYASLPLTGPKLISITVPAADQQDAMFQSVEGNEEHMRPRFYGPYETQLAQIRARAKTIQELEEKHPKSKPLLDKASTGLPVPAQRVRWLPVHHRKGFWTVLIDIENGKPLEYVDFDPY